MSKAMISIIGKSIAVIRSHQAGLCPTAQRY